MAWRTPINVLKLVKEATPGKPARRGEKRRKTKQLKQQEPGGTQLLQTSTRPIISPAQGQLRKDTS